MSTCPDFDYLLVLPRIRVQNANAISSPLTHGFPSMTAFLGLMWALERKAHKAGMELRFRAVGVVCHQHEEQVAPTAFVKTLRLTRNPVGKNGKTLAIAEEGRMHMEVSLVLAVCSEHWIQDPNAAQADAETVAQWLACMRVAGGSVVPPTHPEWRRYQPWVLELTGTRADQLAQFQGVRQRLLPGFALVERSKALAERLAKMRHDQPDATQLDALLSLSRINWHCEVDGQGKVRWLADRQRGDGYLVPIPVGYGALSKLHDPGVVASARDATSPFRFVESLYSIGEWLSPHRLTAPEQLLWYADTAAEEGSYRCCNNGQLPDLDEETTDTPEEFDLSDAGEN